jgi:sRNA-binding carbon storage regulator CsrA
VSGTPTDGSATLFVNKNGVYGWQTSSNNFMMAGGIMPTTGGEYFVSLCGGMTLEIREGAQIVLGNGTGMSPATVTLESGSTLILGGDSDGAVLEREDTYNRLVSKGTLMIHAHSRFIVKPGATLIFNAGGEIILSGADAVLEIQGSRVRLGFDVDASVPIHRAEVWERIRAAELPDGSKEDSNELKTR